MSTPMAHTVLAHDLALALDPALLMHACGLPPDPWQAAVLRSPASRLLLLCCRQSGKSTTTACLALHTALYQPGALVLLLSPSLRQSGELFKKVIGAYRRLDAAIAPEQESAAPPASGARAAHRRLNRLRAARRRHADPGRARSGGCVHARRRHGDP